MMLADATEADRRRRAAVASPALSPSFLGGRPRRFLHRNIRILGESSAASMLLMLLVSADNESGERQYLGGYSGGTNV
jgi:hypothetical protein